MFMARIYLILSTKVVDKAEKLLPEPIRHTSVFELSFTSSPFVQNCYSIHAACLADLQISNFNLKKGFMKS